MSIPEIGFVGCGLWNSGVSRATDLVAQAQIDISDSVASWAGYAPGIDDSPPLGFQL